MDNETAVPAAESEPVPAAHDLDQDRQATVAQEVPETIAVPAEAHVDEETRLEALERALEVARTEAAEYLDGWQRARAELSNARKRFQREQQQAYSGAIGSVLTRLLPVVDDFERALSIPGDEREIEPWIQGMTLIHRKLQQLLDQEGVTRIQTEGHCFDPHLHQALTHEPSDTVPEGEVIGEVQAGYQMGDRVLRPALVRVSAGVPAVPERMEGQVPSGPDNER